MLGQEIGSIGKYDRQECSAGDFTPFLCAKNAYLVVFENALVWYQEEKM